MTRQVLVDPSIIVSRRGQQWLERVNRHGSSAVAIPTALSNLDPVLWNAFSSAYFYRQSVEEGRDWLRNHSHLLAGTPHESTQDLGDVVDEVVDRLGAGMILIARRRELIDLIVAADHPIILRGSPAYADALDILGESLGKELAGSLARRARFTLRVVPVDESGDPRMVLADQGPARY